MIGFVYYDTNQSKSQISGALKMDLHERISINPKICHGEPCIKGTRIMVTNILAAIAEGLPMSEILQDFPDLTPEDVLACVAFANDVVQEKEWYSVAETETIMA